MAQPTEICVFCRGPRLPGDPPEHVIPQWVSRALRKLPGQGKFKLTQSDPTLPSFECALVELTTTAVCKKCNQGWMSNLESRVSPLLQSAILGKGATLPVETHKTLTVWALKTVMMLDCAYGDLGAERFISDDDCHRLYVDRTPELGTFMFASTFGYDPATQTFRDALVQRFRFDLETASKREAVRGNYASTWHYAYFSAQVVCIKTEKELDAFGCADLPLPDGNKVLADDFTRHVWPSRGAVIEWPPPFGLEANGFDIWAANAPFIQRRF